MIQPFALHQVYEQPSYHFFADFSVNEQKCIQEAIDSISLLDEAIPSLRASSYGEKKKNLIHQAIEGLKLSHDHEAMDLEKICNREREGRILSEKIGIYKKQRNILKEALVWEMSVLLRCDRFICPSLPIHIYGEEATFQPFHVLSHTHRFVQEGAPLPKEIDLAEYWILSLYTLLIGHSDLNGTNLHYTENGYFLVDNDWAFPRQQLPILDGPPVQSRSFLHVPLQNVLLDFADAKKKLLGDSYQTVISCLENWKSKREDVERYLALSSLGDSLDKESKEAFWERWRKIVETPFSPGLHLRSWFQEVFPGYFREIQMAQRLALEILTQDTLPRKEPQFVLLGDELVGPMSALHLLGPCLRNRYQRYQQVPEMTKALEEVEQWAQAISLENMNSLL